MGAQLAPDDEVLAQATTEVDLVAGHLVTGRVGDDLALETDVRHLDAGATVRATVEMDRDGVLELVVEVAETLLELGDEVVGSLLRLDDGKLAELQARARHRRAAPRRRTPVEAKRPHRLEQRLDGVVGHVEDDELLVGGQAQPVAAGGLHRVGDARERRTARAPCDRREPDEVASVLLTMHTDVVDRVLRRGRGGPVEQGAPEVLALQHLTRLVGAPVLDEVLETRAVAQPAVAVVAEQLDGREPDLGHLFERHPGTEAQREERLRRQPSPDLQIEAGAVVGVDDADEADVVDLRGGVGQPRDRRLELARQVREIRVAHVVGLDEVDRGGRVDHLVGVHAGHRRTERGARAVTAGLERVETDGLETAPDLRHVLDRDPVVLDVVAVGDVGRTTCEIGGDAREHPQLLAGELPAVDAHAHHEVLVVELLGRQRRRLAAVDALLALGVQAHPAHAAAQVSARDAVEALAGVLLEDAGAHVEGRVLGLEDLVRVERVELALGPLPLGLGRALRGAGTFTRRRHRPLLRRFSRARST